MFCLKCGTEIPAGNAFCTNCGEKVSAPASPDLEKTVGVFNAAPPAPAPAPLWAHGAAP